MSTYADIWLGDSAELAKKFKPKTIKTLLTDPPFGIDNRSNHSQSESGKKHARKIANDESPELAMEIFSASWRALYPAMRDDSDIYVFTSYQVLSEWLDFTRDIFEPLGYSRKGILVWDKGRTGLGDLDSWGMSSEFILYYKRGSWARNDTRRQNVLTVEPVPPPQLIHPHQKPPRLLEMLISHSTKPGDWVVDLFAGSGSFVKAARDIGRNSIGIELDPANHAIAKRFLDGGEGAGFDFGDY